MVGLIVVILIAAAISDSLNDVRAWTLVTIIGTGYIISRGLAQHTCRRAHRAARASGRPASLPFIPLMSVEWGARGPSTSR